MIDPKSAFLAAVGYLKSHPEEFLRTVRNARHLRFGVPVAALQWLATELTAKGNGARDVKIQSCPPGLRVDATVEQMGTELRGSCVIVVERVTIDATTAQVALRLRDVKLSLLDESVQTPLAALVRSGTLDLSRVASLVAYLPSRPSALTEAIDDRLVIDLLKIPRLRDDRRLRHVTGLMASLIAVATVEADIEHLDITLRPFPNGLSQAFRM